MTALTIPRRFNGPAGSANGGWTCGALAAASGLAEPVTVRLRQPPPLESPLDVVPVEGAEPAQVELRDGEAQVALALAQGPERWTAVEPVEVEVARSAATGYAGFRGHPFPRCFSCGPDRAAGDGLRIFPGRLDPDARGRDRVAAPWQPEEPVTLPVLWAALDCAGGWSSDLENRPLVLAQMSARLVEGRDLADVGPGSTCVVVGTLLGVEDRKTWTSTALFDDGGALVAQAEQLWIAVSAAVVAQLQGA